MQKSDSGKGVEHQHIHFENFFSAYYVLEGSMKIKFLPSKSLYSSASAYWPLLKDQIIVPHMQMFLLLSNYAVLAENLLLAPQVL